MWNYSYSLTWPLFFAAKTYEPPIAEYCNFFLPFCCFLSSNILWRWLCLIFLIRLVPYSSHFRPSCSTQQCSYLSLHRRQRGGSCCGLYLEVSVEGPIGGGVRPHLDGLHLLPLLLLPLSLVLQTATSKGHVPSNEASYFTPCWICFSCLYSQLLSCWLSYIFGLNVLLHGVHLPFIQCTSFLFAV